MKAVKKQIIADKAKKTVKLTPIGKAVRRSVAKSKRGEAREGSIVQYPYIDFSDIAKHVVYIADDIWTADLES